jgi:hypothetical protein
MFFQFYMRDTRLELAIERVGLGKFGQNIVGYRSVRVNLIQVGLGFGSNNVGFFLGFGSFRVRLGFKFLVAQVISGSGWVGFQVI